MNKIMLLSLFLFCATLSHAGNLQLDLETCYRNYSNAINRYDLNEVKRYMSEHRYRHIRNLITSQKLNFPDDFIMEAGYELINLKKGKFLFVEENGNTAIYSCHGRGAFYSRSLIIISFIKEGKIWKYNGIKETNFHKVKHLIESNNLDSLKMANSPNGVVPQLESEIGPVQYKGWFNMQTEGYLVQIKINGVEQDIYDDIIRDEVVMGGLNIGKNNVEVDLIPIGNIENKEIRITIRGFISEAERDVFNLYQSEGSIHISKEFEIKEYQNVKNIY